MRASKVRSRKILPDHENLKASLQGSTSSARVHYRNQQSDNGAVPPPVPLLFHDICLVIDCMRMLSCAPHTRSILHLIRLPSLVAGVLKAVLLLYNSVLLSLIPKDGKSRSARVSFDTFVDTSRALSSLQCLTLSLAYLFCNLTECCGIWRYGIPQDVDLPLASRRLVGGVAIADDLHEEDAAVCDARRRTTAVLTLFHR